MAVQYNNAPEWPVLNCVGTLRVGTKDGEYNAYQKTLESGEPGNIVIQVDFVADPTTNGPNLTKYFWFDAQQFNPLADSNDINEYAQNSFNSFFMSKDGFAICEKLTEEEGTGWIKKLEQYYDSQSGRTDALAIAREISSRIDGKLIGYQARQATEKTGEVDAEGKKVKIRLKKYELGDRFFDASNLKKAPRGKNVQNTWES